MIDDKKVVVFIPYGRENTVSVLTHYLARDVQRGLVDEVWLCMNTDPDQTGDVRYAWRLNRHFEWVKIKNRPGGLPRMTPKQRNTGYFYRYMTDPDTVYVRMDDDIVYVHPDAIENLVRSKVAMEHNLACFPVIWNNAVCTWYLQKHGKVPGEAEGWPEVLQPYCMDPIGWANGQMAVNMHGLLLDTLEAGDDPAKFYLYQDIPLPPGEQFSVSSFAVLGTEYAGLTPPGVLTYPEEEHWHTVHQPKATGRSNVIVGNSLVSHYTFYPQQKVVNNTDILHRYRALAAKV